MGSRGHQWDPCAHVLPKVRMPGRSVSTTTRTTLYIMWNVSVYIIDCILTFTQWHAALVLL